MTDYISLSHWGWFPIPEECNSRRFNEPEVMRAELRKFKQGYFSGSENRGVIVDRKE